MATASFVANWKMNKTLAESHDYFNKLQKLLPARAKRGEQVIVAAPYTALASLSEWIKASSLEIGLAAQNLHFAAEGAYTGEISSSMLYETGCRYVIVGHSERRLHFKETDEIIAQKIAAAEIAHLVPIVCVGESEREREQDKTIAVIRRQLKQGLCLGLSSKGHSESGPLDLSDCMIAYEPVWAIGTGKTPTPFEVEKVHQEIYDYLQSEGVEGMPKILYGGSVNEKNIFSFMQKAHIDGVLVGGASLSAERFVQMIELGLEAKETI